MIELIASAALAAPSYAVVVRVTGARAVAPLVRGSVERACVLAIAGLAAAVACAQIFGVLQLVVDGYDRFEWCATPVFFLAGPPVIGAAPWAAGELLSGPSVRQEAAFAAALSAAWLGAAAGFGAGLLGGIPSALAGAAAFSTILAVIAYLHTRGDFSGGLRVPPAARSR